MDNLTPMQRKINMQNIRSFNTVPEQIIMKGLRKNGIYFAKHVKTIFGKPDIVFRRKRIIVFIDSDFWHKNPKIFVWPKSNIKYWSRKITNNCLRDKEVTKNLRKNGWKVVRIWESIIKKNPEKSVKRIMALYFANE